MQTDSLVYNGTKVTRLLYIPFIAVFLVVLAAKTFIRINEGEAVAVFRLGQPLQVSGPGMVMIVPFLDRAVMVKLDSIAGWEAMPEDQLKNEILQKATGSPT